MIRAAAILLLVSTTTLPAQETIRNALGMQLKLIKGGHYIRGNERRDRALSYDFAQHISAQYFGKAFQPAHPCWITRPFYIGRTEVTVGQFAAFVKATGYQTTAEQGAGMIGWLVEPEAVKYSRALDFDRRPEFNWRNPGFVQGEDHPVVGLSIPDVEAFLAWLSKQDGASYRLPSEAEWEFCARAGSTSWFSFGDQPENTIHRHANAANVELEQHRPGLAEHQWLLDWETAPADGHVFTAPVGRYAANALGLHDLHGNVWEWCRDLWLDTAYNAFKNTRGRPTRNAVDPVNLQEAQTKANDFRVIRGGAWATGPVLCISANRAFWDAPDAACYIGFRVVREADPSIDTTAREAFQREQKAVQAIQLVGGELRANLNDGLDVTAAFEGEKFDERALGVLRHIPGIDEVTIRGRDDVLITQRGIDLLADLADLKRLDFGCPMAAQLDLSPLARLPRLRQLSFPRVAPLNDRHMQTLAGMKGLTHFSAYGIAGGLSDAGLAQLAGNRNLESIRLYEAELSGTGLKALAQCPLKSFEMSKVHDREATFTDAGVQLLASFTQLEVLRLQRQTTLSAAAIPTIAGLSRLQQLSLEGCSNIPDEAFAPLGGLTSLQHLSLRDTQASDATLAAIRIIPRLDDLQLARVGAPGMAHLAELFSLRKLYIADIEAGDRDLAALGRINRLEHLDIGGIRITGSGLGPLAALPGLKDLKLRTPGLTDHAFEHLSRAKSLHKLRLVERGVKPPAALSNAGMMKMAKATWLKELWLPRNDTGLTEEKIQELNKLMPKTGVIPYTVQWK